MSADETTRHRTAAEATVDLHSGVPRLLVVDDQAEMRWSVAKLLADTFRVVGMAEDGKEAIELAELLSPDVVVLDIGMPVLNGIEAAERMRGSQFPSKVVFLSIEDAPEFIEAAFAAGALGYVLKSSLGTDLISAIWQAIEGRPFVSPALHYYTH
jgi:DNA-binding NarL/FixJ family response regulator